MLFNVKVVTPAEYQAHVRPQAEVGERPVTATAEPPQHAPSAPTLRVRTQGQHRRQVGHHHRPQDRSATCT